jgi:TolA-binding protein
MLRLPKAAGFGLFLLFIPLFLTAQRNLFYTGTESTFREARDLLRNQKFSAAQSLFDEVAVQSMRMEEIHVESRYFAALCAYELFHDDAAFRMRSFVRNYPESQRVKTAFFYLGNLMYRQKNYREALEWYEKTEAIRLARDQRFELKFKKAYCYFITKKDEQAKTLFADIKDIDNKYAAPATYYFSHICYEQGNYETALSGFKKFSSNSTFSPLVPYYIAHIYYHQGKYAEVIETAKPLADTGNVKRAPEMSRLVADAYYRLGKFQEARTYFRRFQEGGLKPSREDRYMMAYAAYKTEDYAEAIDQYQKVVILSDSMTQVSWYQLGDCFLKSGNKQSARSAFEAASKFNFDKDIEEDALFSYAKLSYELAYNPYHEAVEAFQSYIDKYPQSSRLDEAYKLLVNVYLSTRNFKDALSSISKIKKLNLEMQMAWQKIAYSRAVELFNDKSYESAIEHFKLSLKYPKTKSLNALAHYWSAESYYRMSKYQDAAEAYKSFLFEPGAVSLPEFGMAHYSLGYCYFEAENYKEALIWFRKFTSNKKEPAKRMLNDALIRQADIWFMQKDYESANASYEEALEMGLVGNDYALFQLAMAKGLAGGSTERIRNLETLLSKYPQSDYADDAKYELGNAWLVQNNQEKALQYLSSVVDEYPKSSYVKRALVKKALIYYNTDQDKLALESYQMVIARYPNTTESREALQGIRNIYVETGDVASFEDYLRSQPGIAASPSVLDSTAYEAAERKLMKGDCDAAVAAFKSYIEKYPKGYFILNARYYKADCQYRSGQGEEALDDFRFVASQSRNKFTENALSKASAIAWKKKDYALALQLYQDLESNAEVPLNVLEARAGQMRCQYHLGKYDECILLARRVAGMEKASQTLITETHLLIGKSAKSAGNDSLAFSELNLTAKAQSEAGAEANYLLAELWFKQKEYQKTENTIYDLVDRVPSYDYWIARGFILLADNFLAREDKFQAKETLKSIIEKCEIPELVEEARNKLKAIEEQERKAEEKWKQVETEIKFDTNSVRDNQLFEEENPIPEQNEKNP